MEFEKVKSIISELFMIDPDEIFMDTTFVDDLGADSLDIYNILVNIEDEFDIEISNEAAEAIVTVGDVVAQIKKVTE